MSQQPKKKSSRYQELDNYEEAESADNPKALGLDRKSDLKSAEIHSAEQLPKIFLPSTNEGTPDKDNKDPRRQSLSNERKKKEQSKESQEKASFSPKTYKRNSLKESREPEKDRIIALENNIKELIGILNDNTSKLDREAKVEKTLIEKLSTETNILRNESVLQGLKRVFEILKDKSPSKMTINHDVLVELLLKALDQNCHKDLVQMLTGDSVLDKEEEMENKDGMDALRESYHEFSLKKLMQMSFVEKRKLLALNNKLTPLTVQTNSIMKNALNGVTKDTNKKPDEDDEDEDTFCSMLKRNIVLIICSILITALICVILLI